MKKTNLIIAICCLLAACEPSYPTFTEALDHLKDQEDAPFYHGVASGDPLTDAVIIWTRVTPPTQMPSVTVSWEVSSDQGFTDVLQSGTIETDATKDFTVKVDITDLTAGTQYFYRFNALNSSSPIGTTKTAPESGKVSFAVVSCSNYEWGYFNAYQAIAELDDLDAVLHLGDYIYEYGPGSYGDTSLNRINIPAKEIITLSDYRTRYAQYRLDEDLKAAHGKVAFINIWDDHEIANDSYKTGAQNHQENEGSYEERKNAAVQAYYEWMPIRESETLYRKFDYGNIAEVFMMDERLEGRTSPVDSLKDPSINNADRSMLGQEQLDWLLSGLSDSPAKWKVIGNQVIYSYLNWGFEPSFTINLDSWDGYPYEQAKIADHIKTNNIENVVFVTGDTHSAWAFEVTNDPFESYDAETSEGAFAVEFGTTSINSANSNERASDDEVREHEAKIANSPVNPHLKYANLRDHGFLVLTLTDDQARAEWNIVSTVREKNFTTTVDKTLTVNSGDVKLRGE
jgi:alkaline phosphatase D